MAKSELSKMIGHKKLTLEELQTTMCGGTNRPGADKHSI
jgi:hypothetical protein